MASGPPNISTEDHLGTTSGAGERITATRQAPPARKIAALVYIVCVGIYALFAAERLPRHSADNHFSYLADAYLHGQLAVRCSQADVSSNRCPCIRRGNDWAQYKGRWYVVFPSFPAVLYAPAVALLGRDFRNVILDVILAGLAPAWLYLLLERLSRERRSPRSWRENLALTALFAFGTVYFYSAVQGDVWYTAHLAACALAVGYLWFALDARRPFLAGVIMALAFHTRANFVYATPLFALEAIRVHRQRGLAPGNPLNPSTLRARIQKYLQGVHWPKALAAMTLFALPIAFAIGVMFGLNKLRFGNFHEVGYRYLNVIQHDRMEQWGLFNYHYLARNLGVALASLPWLSRTLPYLVISYHGLALWVTTPHYLEVVRLRRRPEDVYTPFLALSTAILALLVLLYQNTGWQQFGYRFSNDFAVFLVVLLALNGSRIGKRWLVFLALAIAINAFGAATYSRGFPIRGEIRSFYTGGNTQPYYQPD